MSSQWNFRQVSLCTSLQRLVHGRSFEWRLCCLRFVLFVRRIDPGIGHRISADPRSPAAAQPSAHFDPEAATNAYLATIPPSAKSRSDAYFEGGYWLILWDFLYGAAISLLLLNLRWSAAMRDVAERVTTIGPIRTAIYWVEYVLLIAVLGFPLVVYEGYFREHKYGLATQTFGPWMLDQVKGACFSALVLGALLVAVLLRLRPKTGAHPVDLGSSRHDRVSVLRIRVADRAGLHSFRSSTRSRARPTQW